MAPRDPERQYEREKGPQPDPFLHEGRSNSVWVWMVSAAIVVVLIVTFVAVSGRRHVALNQPNHGPPITTGSGSTSPHTALPTGRGTADAPLTGQSNTVR